MLTKYIMYWDYR